MQNLLYFDTSRRPADNPRDDEVTKNLASSY